jgi:hypothetical protein
MESPSPTLSSPLRLVEESKTDKPRDRPCSQPPPPSNSAPDDLQFQGHNDSLSIRLSQMTLKNKRLQATLHQRTAEQFQRMRGYEEIERQNKVMVEGLEQFQDVLHGLQEQVQTLQNKVDAILGKL